VYSRERALDISSIIHVEPLSAPIVHIALSGKDSLLAYSQENLLYHYIINVSNAAVKLVQVGQIALHGIIRAPLRVRALSWMLPEDQLGESIIEISVNSSNIARKRQSLTRCRNRNHNILGRWETSCLTAIFHGRWTAEIQHADNCSKR
jgi:hypothetical protein